MLPAAAYLPGSAMPLSFRSLIDVAFALLRSGREQADPAGPVRKRDQALVSALVAVLVGPGGRGDRQVLQRLLRRALL